MPDEPLAGLTLVLTRPRLQALAVQEGLRRAGAHVVIFPVLAIEALESTRAPEPPIDAAIFVSANAAQFGWPLLQALLQERAQIYAVGEATARALTALGAANVRSPKGGNDSEALLALPELGPVRGRSIVLVRGLSEAGGRRLLAETLAARGARVQSFECYRRHPVSAGAEDHAALRAAWPPHALWALSVETAASLRDNLRDNLQSYAGWQAIPLLTPHRRVAEAAHAMGFLQAEVAPLEEAELLAWLHERKPELLRTAQGQTHG